MGEEINKQFDEFQKDLEIRDSHLKNFVRFDTSNLQELIDILNDKEHETNRRVKESENK